MGWSDEIELVFLPGLDGTGLSYGPLGEALPKNIQVTVVSYPTGEKLSFTELVRCVYEQLPQNKPLVLIAESFSGPVSISLARSFPSDIKGIIFCATFMKYTRPFLLGLARCVPLSLLLRKPAPDFLLSFLCGDEPFFEKLSHLFRQIEKQINPEVIAHRIRMLSSIDVTDEAKNLHFPCCYIQAFHDRVVPARSVLPFRKYLPDISLKRVNGPHGILQAQPEECAQIIIQFANGLLETRNGKHKIN